MNLSEFERDPVRVQSHLREMDDGSVVSKKPCKLYIPARFRDKNLATVGNEIYVLGIFMLTVEDRYYAVNNINAMMRIEPSSINTVVLNDKDHYEFVFEAGDLVFASTDLVKNDKLLYYIFDEIVAKGNVPVYLNYLDLGRIFDTAPKHAGVTLASTPTILHMLLSVVARDPDNLNQFFRQVTNGKDFERVKFVQLRSSTHGANNTTARLLGSHFSDNLDSALVNPSDREENIERILRM
jgi:hypothetical protein